MPGTIDAHALKAALKHAGEIALVDVREAGPYSEGHPFHVVPLAYSRLELDAERLLPRRDVRLVIVDGGDGLSTLAARRLEALGFSNVSILTGGAPAWKAAGYTLFEGVNVPSKAFGEVVEIARHTPRINARELVAMQQRGDNMVIVDGRTWDEYTRFNIPGGLSCPNGELVLHIDGLVKDPKTKVVVNCAGRTRSIIGAQTLIDWGIANEVVALENGTQGFWLEGLPIEKGANRRVPSGDLTPASLEAKRTRATRHAQKHGVRFIGAEAAVALATDPTRTTYLLDVRTHEEFARAALPGFVHAPGGQLQQATDQWVGVKGAHLILTDMGEMIRAPFVAAWLRQLGHDAVVLTDVASARTALEAAAIAAARKPKFDAARIRMREMLPAELAGLISADQATVVDLRPSMAYREKHIPGSLWSIRPRLARDVGGNARTVVLVADDPRIAALAALDLAEAGCGEVALLKGGVSAWTAANQPTASSPDIPTDKDCVDFVFHTLGRNEGNLDAARAYLAWEINLVGQLDPDERASFRL